MRMILALVAVLYSAAAFAQADKPPMVGDKPLVQVKPKTKGTAAAKGTAKGTEAAATAPAPKGKPQSTAVRLQSCLDIDDGTKDRLNCYDAVIPPTPKPK